MYYKTYPYEAMSIYQDNGEEICFLQGQDCSELMSEIEKLDELWDEIYCKIRENDTGFNSYEEHLNLLLEHYITLEEA